MYEFIRLHNQLVEHWDEMQRSYEESLDSWNTPGRRIFHADRWSVFDDNLQRYIDALSELRVALEETDHFLQENSRS